MKRFLCVFLSLFITLSCLPCPAGAAEANWNGPLSQDAGPTLCDTGRGYIVYYLYASAVYYSEDGVTWTDLSDRQWVQDARAYIPLTSPMVHREFQFIWTGAEYMMRQDLRDDPRLTHQKYGDSPRNSTVTFLDEDFQIIGELPLGGAVTDIRYEDGAYYATVDGSEVAFTREEREAGAVEAHFSDVDPDAWYAQAVELCAEKGVMVGTGEDTFSPSKELTQAECLTLAFRLYDLTQGREHTIETAPEDWGKITLTLADGMVYEGYGSLGKEENRTFTWWEWRNGVKGVCAQVPGWSYETDVETAVHAQHAWMDAHPDICGQDAPATLTLNGLTYQGTTRCWMPVGPYVFMFLPEPDQADEVNTLLHHAVYYEVGPERWWQDICYTIAQRELEDIFDPSAFRDNFANRWDFAEMLSQAVGKLPALRTVDIPDLDRDYLVSSAVYDLYDAGILTGVDAYGTFAGDGTLTRAQAAVMVARVLDESLRVSDPLAPLPTEGYTLTHLMDGSPDCGVRYPVCVLGNSEENEGHNGVLLLDGTLLPWPGSGEGTPSYALNPCGDYVYFGVYDETTQDPYDTKAGLMDRNGDFIVPMENGRTQSTYAIEGGFFSRLCPTDGAEVWALLDEHGQLIREVPVEDADPQTLYPPKARQPYQGIQAAGNRPGESGYRYYADANGSPISQKFDWASHITNDGQGFVGLDGKIYRIQFE